MDNTELHYLTYDPDAIWHEMIVAYVNAGGEPLYGGDEKEILLRTVLALFVQGFAAVDNALLMQTVRYAVGDYLDMVGERFGVQRIKASKARATAEVVNVRIPNAFDVIPAGTYMTADGTTFYETVSEVTYLGDHTTEIVAVKAGAKGNALYADTIMFLSERVQHISSFKVLTDASGGADEETDKHYRARIYRSFGSFVTTGTATQYESAALSASADVIDVRAYEGDLQFGAGMSTVVVYLLLDNMTVPDTERVMADVTAAVTSANRKPLTDIVEVLPVDKIPYWIEIKYLLGTATSESITAAINQYKEWQNTKIGRAFNPDRLVSLLYSAGCERVIIDTEESHFNNGPCEYTEIERYEACSGGAWARAIE